MNEIELIQQLTRSLPANTTVRVGAGDDCAVLDLGLKDEWILFKTDAVVQDIHFTLETAPDKIGHKALARCLSDFAAMAGKPTAALITLGLPANFEPGFVEKIYEGMKVLAARYDVAIVGGETVANPSRLFMSVSMIGTAPKKRCVLRSGAKAGDAMFVTGDLGGSLAGKHLDFEPRVTEAQWLAKSFDVHAMIDLSDGLATDLRHILEASKLGAELQATAIPISRAAHIRAKKNGKPALIAALTDGEDFELLFTVASKDAVPLLDAFKKEFPDLRLSCIGKITSEPGVRIRDRDGIRPLTAHGYDHFQKP